MFCSQCGSEIKVDQARFCSNCGTALISDADAGAGCVEETCLIACIEVREKWSFFGKDVSVFRAIHEDPEDKTVVAESKEFIVTGFNYEGPSKVNKIHAEAFADLEAKLEKQGWKSTGKYGPHWYCQKFKRLRKSA